MELLHLVIQIYWFICILSIVFSWLPDMGEGGGFVAGIRTLVYTLTEPVFSTVRRAMPRVGDLPIDFSPIVVFIALGILMQITGSLART